MSPKPYCVVLEGDSSGSAEVGIEFAVCLFAPEVEALTIGEQGPPGPPGRDAPGAGGAPIISADPDNRITQGADGGLYSRDNLIPDPLAYYILARS